MDARWVEKLYQGNLENKKLYDYIEKEKIDKLWKEHQKGLKDNAVVKLKDTFVRLGTFQSIDPEDISKLTKHLSYIKKQPTDADTSSFPELNSYMDLILSEQKALLEEINNFIGDILKIKKDVR